MKSFFLILLPALAFAKPFQIEVIDDENGWPVPLVRLETTHNVTFVTDNAGVVAIDAPELMGQEIWLTVASDGYQVPADGFGNRGIRVTPVPGGSHRIEVGRTIIAKRLGRLTGAGLFAESQKLGRHLEWKECGIFGCDSIQTTLHRGKKFWAWGDTNVGHYPLGLFHMTSATTEPSPLPSLEPPLKLALDYFRAPDDRPRSVAKLPGEGPTWLNGYLSLSDKDGTPRLVATYSKIRNHLDVHRLGLCLWNEEKELFESHKILWEHSAKNPKPPRAPEGHPVIHTDPDGVKRVYFGDPFPKLRMPATFEAWQDPEQWEELTPQPVVMTKKGLEITPHRGSVTWNTFREKWVTVFTQLNGKPSPLGEIWYAEAEHPSGPWENAVKILSHAKHTFYNPRIHSDLTPGKSPVLIFEGTYTVSFSNTSIKTPRYDYNQILYRLDLDDPALTKK